MKLEPGVFGIRDNNKSISSHRTIPPSPIVHLQLDLGYPLLLPLLLQLELSPEDCNTL